MAYTTVVAGTVITASWGNSDVRDQVVVPFASEAARDAAITSPVAGQVAATTDTYSLWFRGAASWARIGPLAAAWTSYTPTLTASSINPTLGSGSSAVGYYHRVGRLINFYAKIAWGTSGATAGSGQYRISLPVTATSNWLTGGSPPIGCGVINDSGTNYFGYDAVMEGSTYVLLINGDSNGTNVIWANNAPFVPSNQDFVIVTGTYEAAS